MKAKKIIGSTMEYLKKNFPQEQEVKLVIAEGYDCIEAPDGGAGFGVYDSNTRTIYLATDVPYPETSLIETTAHEYKHFMQHCEGQPFDEEEAENFAYYIVYLLTGHMLIEG